MTDMEILAIIEDAEVKLRARILEELQASKSDLRGKLESANGEIARLNAGWRDTMDDVFASGREMLEQRKEIAELKKTAAEMVAVNKDSLKKVKELTKQVAAGENSDKWKKRQAQWQKKEAELKQDVADMGKIVKNEGARRLQTEVLLADAERRIAYLEKELPVIEVLPDDLMIIPKAEYERLQKGWQQV